MKSLIFLAAVVMAMAFTSNNYSTFRTAVVHSDTTKLPLPKNYCVSQSLDEWVRLSNILEYVKGQLKQTDLKAKDVSYLTDSLIAPFQQVMAAQINSQIAKDTVKTKK